ncbi:MAG: hypothetical protein ACJAT2_001174 [Bacteriovoracaceae bacterium]|jgi:hypothetical protein
MKLFTQAKKTLILTLIFLSTGVFATPLAIQSRYEISLSDFTGISFLQTMIYEGEGIVSAFDADYIDTYEFATIEQVDYAIDNFDKKNKNRILRMFDFDKSKLRDFTKKLKEVERSFTPETVSDQVGNVLSLMDIRGDKYSLGQFMAIASGAGTLIRINKDNYFYNIGYFAPEVRSGRSYGATTLHNANDASHLMYLRQLESFLKYDNDHAQFFSAIIKFLVDTDVSIYDDPSFNKYGEAVLTDYITVYTAELRRQLMRGLSPWSAPWGNDMTEATFLSFFNVKSGRMMLEEGLVEASIKEHWALSPTGSGRSGFGINRKPRRVLQAGISNFFRNHENSDLQEVAFRMDRLIGKKSDGDIYRGMMEYINNKKNLLNPQRVEKIEDDIADAFVSFLIMANQHSDEILEVL